MLSRCFWFFLLFIPTISWADPSFCFIGTIVSSVDGQSLAVLRYGTNLGDYDEFDDWDYGFEAEKKAQTYFKHRGESFAGRKICSILHRQVCFQVDAAVDCYLAGDCYEPHPERYRVPEKEPEDEYEEIDGEINVTERFRDYYSSGMGLIKTLMAASVEKVEGGFLITNIDKDSVFDKIGLKDGDIIFQIRGIELKETSQAITLLKSLKSETDVDYTVFRDGYYQGRMIHVK